MDTSRATQEAMRLHQSGRLTEAEAAYRNILAQTPGRSDALHLLGMLCGQTGRTEMAIDLISQAIAVDRNIAGYHIDLGNAFRRIGRLDEAIAAYRRGIQLDPQSAHAQANLGIALSQLGRFGDAIAPLRRAIELDPHFAQAYRHLGIALGERGNIADAIAAFRRAVQLNPTFADALYNLGNALKDSEQPAEAIAAYRKAIDAEPDYADAWSNLGIVLSEQGEFDPAIAAFRRAIAIKPDFAEAHNNLAIAIHHQAIEIHAAASSSLEVISEFESAIQLQPDYAEAHYNQAFVLLRLGDYRRGWPEHEWRWRTRLPFLFPVHTFKQPQWDGGELKGRTVFLHAEQGFGDAIQFARFVPMVAERGGCVILGCQPHLFRLFQSLPRVEKIVTIADPLPDFDLHCPLMSLPLAFSTELNSIPSKMPYLMPDPALVDHWKSRIGPTGGVLKVGLGWSGNPKHRHNRTRAVRLQQMAPLAEIEGVSFYSVQKGDAAKQPRPPGLKLTDWTDELHDFADTAALMANLDLIISTDTAVVHLAGALGKPMWTLLRSIPDWRWLLDRQDSPWYPTMRLFRQPSRGDWPSTIRALAGALRSRASPQGF